MIKLQNAVKKQKKNGERGMQKGEKHMTIKNFIFLNEDHRKVPRLIAITLTYIFDEFYALALEASKDHPAA